jgi:hypothetical protein
MQIFQLITLCITLAHAQNNITIPFHKRMLAKLPFKQLSWRRNATLTPEQKKQQGLKRKQKALEKEKDKNRGFRRGMYMVGGASLAAAAITWVATAKLPEVAAEGTVDNEKDRESEKPLTPEEEEEKRKEEERLQEEAAKAKEELEKGKRALETDQTVFQKAMNMLPSVRQGIEAMGSAWQGIPRPIILALTGAGILAGGATLSLTSILSFVTANLVSLAAPLGILGSAGASVTGPYLWNRYLDYTSSERRLELTIDELREASRNAPLVKIKPKPQFKRGERLSKM